MREDRADIALTFSYPGDRDDPHGSSARGLAVRAVGTDDLLAVLPDGHPAAAGERVDVSALADENWIAGCPRCRGHLLELCGRAGFEPRIGFETDNFVAVEGLVAQGIGVATLPRMAVESFPLLPGVDHAAAAARRGAHDPRRDGARRRARARGAHRPRRADPRARLAAVPGRRPHGARGIRELSWTAMSTPDPRTTTASGADVRVRFCPSPTGLPHVGLIRTVLFNWAYARHNGGTLVFRIEDTDAARDSEESYLQLLDALRWLEIDWDEGVEVGGPHAPYRQSQRHDIYRERARQAHRRRRGVRELLDTPKRSTPATRRTAARSSSATTTSTATSPTSRRQPSAPRAASPPGALRVPDEDLTYVDLIRGEVTFPAGSFPDFVVVRAGGSAAVPVREPGRRRAHGHHARASAAKTSCRRPPASSRCTARSSTPA